MDLTKDQEVSVELNSMEIINTTNTNCDKYNVSVELNSMEI